MNDDFKNKKSDYLLELALEEQLEHDIEMEKYKGDNKILNPHVFSQEHEKRIREIFKMAEKAEKKSRRTKRFHQMAAGVLLFLGISTFSVTQVEAFRLPIIRFFTEIKEKSTLFNFNKENNTGLTENYKEYEPYYEPEGFSSLAVHEEEGEFHIEYLNEQKQQVYTFFFFDSVDSIAIDTEEGDTAEIKIDGNQAYLVQKEEEIRMLMIKDNKQFYLAGPISYEEAVKIMKSIK
ncbi:MAG: DUF4367 domain-containing protein [Lacrimispora sp.]|uniref:DUF4367 domain-containing protein n=1 Tax=Lacrimispora sp. TaxID=2719234 RepID=UPI0039E411EF